jgi:hypothetical protein
MSGDEILAAIDKRSKKREWLVSKAHGAWQALTHRCAECIGSLKRCAMSNSNGCSRWRRRRTSRSTSMACSGGRNIIPLCRGCSSAARRCAPVGAKYTICQCHSTPVPIVRDTRLWSTAVAHHCAAAKPARRPHCEETTEQRHRLLSGCILYIRCVGCTQPAPPPAV